MLDANGAIDSAATASAMLPIVDRNVSLRRAATGAWLVALSATDDPWLVVESGTGRTPAEAYWRALQAYAGADEDARVLLVRVDEWGAAGGEPGSVFVVADTSAYATDSRSCRDALESVRADQGLDVVRARFWVCDGEGITTIPMVP